MAAKNVTTQIKADNEHNIPSLPSWLIRWHFYVIINTKLLIFCHFGNSCVSACKQRFGQSSKCSISWVKQHLDLKISLTICLTDVRFVVQLAWISEFNRTSHENWQLIHSQAYEKFFPNYWRLVLGNFLSCHHILDRFGFKLNCRH